MHESCGFKKKIFIAHVLSSVCFLKKNNNFIKYNYNVLMYNVDHKEEGHGGTMSSLKLASTLCGRNDEHKTSGYTE